MAWNPKNNTIDISKVTANLFAYLEENQEDAINWAEGSLLVPVLPKFQKIYKSSKGRISTIFPCLMLIDKSLATDPGNGDLITAGFRFLFEVQLQGGNTDTLVDNAEIYARALESMLTNLPGDVLCDDTFKPTSGSMDGIETDFDEVRQHKTIQSAYLQVFQTEVTYILNGAAFN